MANNTYKIPIFATSKYENIQPNIDNGVINNFGYIYVKDSGKLAFVDKNLQIHLIKGDNDEYIKKIDSLESEGNEDILYLYEGVYYTFLDGEYKPLLKDVNDHIEEIDNTIAGIEDTIENINTKLESADSSLTELSESISQIKGQIENVTQAVQEAESASNAYTDEALTIYEFVGIDEDEENNGDDVNSPNETDENTNNNANVIIGDDDVDDNI